MTATLVNRGRPKTDQKSVRVATKVTPAQLALILKHQFSDESLAGVCTRLWRQLLAAIDAGEQDVIDFVMRNQPNSGFTEFVSFNFLADSPENRLLTTYTDNYPNKAACVRSLLMWAALALPVIGELKTAEEGLGLLSRWRGSMISPAKALEVLTAQCSDEKARWFLQELVEAGKINIYKSYNVDAAFKMVADRQINCIEIL